MALIITGHQRSGTTLLGRLFEPHPEVRITGEFGYFLEVGAPRGRYVRRLLKRWGGIAIRGWRWNVMIPSNRFVLQYLHRIVGAGADGVTVEVIEQALHDLLPGVQVVGDKYPEYIWSLDDLATKEGLSALVIYRDCRDVTSSTLIKARTDWRHMPLFVRKLDTAEKVARRWVRAIDLMEAHRDKIFMVRYEELVTNAREQTARISEWLGIDPEGFKVKHISDSSIGRYQSGLTQAEIDTVMKIAGPTMARLGYL
jgi:hypothetical protein